MKDELDEGDFDNDGFYHWKKDKDEIKDAWLDNVDWANINSFKKSEQLTKEAKLDENEDEEVVEEENIDDEDEETSKASDQTEKFKKILEYLKPGETILKAIKRLGTSSKGAGGQATSTAGLSASQRWLKKKNQSANAPESSKEQSEKAKVDKEALEKLTGICNQFISQGFYDIYEETFESVEAKIQGSNGEGKASSSFDIFAEDVNEVDLKPGTSGSQKDLLEGNFLHSNFKCVFV